MKWRKPEAHPSPSFLASNQTMKLSKVRCLFLTTSTTIYRRRCLSVGRLRLSGSTVEAVLTLAVRWQLEQVVDACCSFLGDHLRPSNCLAVLRLAGDNGCSGLKSLAGFYIAVGYLLYNCFRDLVAWKDYIYNASMYISPVIKDHMHVIIYPMDIINISRVY